MLLTTLLAMDYEVQRCTRRCAATGRELQPGETIYSALCVERGQVARHDYAADAWQGPPEGALAWWKSHLPTRETKRAQWAPNDVMLELFEQLEDRPDQADLRYVLSLLLVRRRVLRLEETEHDASGGEVSVLYCPRRETQFRVATTLPDDARARQIQDELTRLLSGGRG